jgi:outer membrane autotransporter protein
VTGNLILGTQVLGTQASSGTYELSGTGSLAAQNEIVGGAGTGVFNQTGGSHVVSNTLTLAETAGSTGSYNLSGGTLTASYLDVKNGGAFTQTGGTFIPASQCYIYPGGTFDVTNGIVDGSSNTIFITEATVNLTNSRFGCGAMEVHNGGIINQNGNLADGSSNTIFINEGTFNLKGGTYTCNTSLGVYGAGGRMNVNNGAVLDGTSNTILISEGEFNQNNSTVRCGSLEVHDGTFNLDGGFFRCDTSLGVYGAGGKMNVNNGAILDGSSNTILVSEGRFNLNNSTLRCGSMAIRRGGAFTQSGISDGTSNTIAIIEGTWAINGGTYSTGTLNLYAGGELRWTGGDLNYQTLNLMGGNFYGNLQNTNTISGTGTITGDIVNQGTISPGTSPGVLNIVGSFSQASPGVYIVEVASASSYDQINVSGNPGTASLGGSLSAELLNNFRPPRNLVLPDIITATGGVTGRFASAGQLTPILALEPRYNANSVDLLVTANFANAGLPLTANQRNVGVMLNGLNTITSGDLGTVLDAVSYLPTGAAVADAYQQISPDKASALPSLSLAGATMQWQSVANRLSYQRWARGSLPNLAGGRSGSVNLSYNSLAGLMLAYNGADLSGMAGSLRPPADSAGTWGLFTDFVSTFGTQDSTGNITGYTFSVLGFNVGADYRLRDDLVMGFGTGYYDTGASFRGSGGAADISSIPFYLYGAYTPGSFYAMGYLGYTLNLYGLDRNIAFGGINRTATSSVSGNQLNISLETGYDFRVAQFTITPAATLYYSQAWVGGFTEDGAGSLNLDVDAQSADSLQTGLGMRLSLPFKSGTTLILPQIYAFYQHEFVNNNRGLDARLAQTGSTFGFQTESPSRDFAVLGAGLALGLRQNLTLRANYNTEVGRGGYTPHMVSAGLRYEF